MVHWGLLRHGKKTYTYIYILSQRVAPIFVLKITNFKPVLGSYLSFYVFKHLTSSKTELFPEV